MINTQMPITMYRMVDVPITDAMVEVDDEDASPELNTVGDNETEGENEVLIVGLELGRGVVRMIGEVVGYVDGFTVGSELGRSVVGVMVGR